MCIGHLKSTYESTWYRPKNKPWIMQASPLICAIVTNRSPESS